MDSSNTIELSRFKAFIFDMDGVFIDTEPLQFETFRQVFAPLNVFLPDDYMYGFVGEPTQKNLEDISRDYQVDLDIPLYMEKLHNTFKELFREQDPDAQEGIWQIIEIAKKANKKIALCTSSRMIDVEFVFTKIFAGNKTYNTLNDLFNVVITADLLTFKKPHPEPYLTSCAKLGLLPEHCLVVEDSILGIRSAKDAGCFCAGLKKPYNYYLRSSRADVVYDNLVHMRENIKI